jgi:DNA modification methylase
LAKKTDKGSGVNSAAIEQVSTASLIPYARNARTHSETQVKQIAGSIQEFGFCNPVLIDATNGIIAGHGRVMAAQLLKLESVPCLRLSHLTDAQKRAYVLADNRIALSSGWDEEMLANELSDLHADEFDMALLGFDVDELAGLLKLNEDESAGTSAGEVVEDEVPEVPVDPITKPGNLWILGEHRLLCGDSTKAEDVGRLMAGAKADLCFTSPPYGQQRDYTKEGKEKVSDWDGLMRGVFANLPMTESGQVLVNLGLIHRECEWVPYWDGWIEWMRSQGWRRFGWYVWDQGFGLPGNWNGRFAPSHEFVFHFNKQSIEPVKFLAKKPENIKARTEGTSTMRGKDGECKAFTNPEASAQPNKIPESVIRINRMHGGHDIEHLAIFPVTFPTHAMNAWPGVAYEPFCGSGSTLIAAEQLNRKCYGMEISPAYCDVIVKRWENLTGKKAVLEAA